MNRKMMPATGGAIPYGQRTAARYIASPRTFWVARAATNRPVPRARAVTPDANTKLFKIDR